ncbi:cytochrome c oxidase subunit 6B1-like [Ciona intestinalis]
MATIEERIKHFRTAPFDPRFPQTNQARSCFQNYIDFHRCERVFNEKGKDTAPCEYFKMCYNSLCPNEWKDKFDTWRENDTFPTKL